MTARLDRLGAGRSGGDGRSLSRDGRRDPGGCSGGAFALDQGWFFDARRHLWCRAGAARPDGLYRGPRARLLAENGIAAGKRGGCAIWRRGIGPGGF